jgi:hypothetical protein
MITMMIPSTSWDILWFPEDASPMTIRVTPHANPIQGAIESRHVRMYSSLLVLITQLESLYIRIALQHLTGIKNVASRCPHPGTSGKLAECIRRSCLILVCPSQLLRHTQKQIHTDESGRRVGSDVEEGAPLRFFDPETRELLRSRPNPLRPGEASTSQQARPVGPVP